MNINKLIIFLILVLKEDISFEDVPKELWNTEFDNLMLDERNLHFILNDLSHPFRVMRGHFRFYGSEEEFNDSDYSTYFIIFNDYNPQHHLYAFDYSAIEPRTLTMASKEPEYLKIFEGEEKVIAKEIDIEK